VVLITLFEVPEGADEAFLDGWDAAAVLHRALRADVDFRFVSLAPDSAPQRPETPFVSHPGLYEVVHEDGAPDGAGGVVLINPFAVPADADDAFVDGWSSARDALAGEHGYLGTRLHRSAGEADFRFVNVARWSSPLMFARAVGRPEFREQAGRMPFASHPALYTVIRGG
jgi:heme oxygenase (mycobilin-producing)